ncbi:MAG: diguanylate cyclase [Sideroxydans sp.]|nr:diguanylate cyclase [Sideroxydans sp.]
MTRPTTPSEIARDAMKMLLARKEAPTPENYARAYQEVSGTKPAAAETDAAAGNTARNEQQPWNELIRDLLKQLETPHKGITISRKKEGLETVLAKFASNQATLFEKLRGLIRSWAGPTTGSPVEAVPAPEIDAAMPAAAGKPSRAAEAGINSPVVNDELMSQLREMLAQTLESMLPLQADLSTEIKALAQQIRAARNNAEITLIAKHLRQFWLKLELRGGDKIKIQEGLMRLLRLLVENVGELVADDKWLHGQISTLQEIIANPLDRRSIADAERNLRDAIIKQSTLKQSLADAKTTLKTLMTTFIDRMGKLTESTGEYHAKIESYNQKIGQADNLPELSHILEDIMHDTRIIQTSVMRSHEELLSARKQVTDAEERIKRLEDELEQISELIHEDQLTGALNRRGMDEMFERETQRADRNQTPISIALLDIDNFKQLNDTLGHQVGDSALVHLSNVIKESLRPSDAVARYGGEEFIIVLPDTSLDEAVETVNRLQRELTKKFFLHNNERLLVTFSAGVALRANNEDTEDVIGRADKAMYQAKLAGKNRVFKAS